MALATYKDLCIDAVDPDVLGRFWASALHLRLERSTTATPCSAATGRSRRCGSTRCPSR